MSPTVNNTGHIEPSHNPPATAPRGPIRQRRLQARPRLISPLAVVGAAAAVALSGCTSAGSSVADSSLAEMDPVTLKIATLFGPDNWFTKPMEEFTERVEKKTDGKVSFEYFYAGSLVPADELPRGLGDGIFDFGFILPAYDPSAFEVDTWTSPLAVAYEPTPIVGTLQAAAASLDWSSEQEAYSQQFLDANVFPLLPQYNSASTYGLLCKQDNSSLEQIKGKRVRVAGEAWAKEAKHLGMVPVTMPISEVYQAFQKGVIDCFLGTPNDAYASGFTEFAKFYNNAGLTGYASSTYGFNLDSWNALPDEAKDIIWDELPGYAEGITTAYINENIRFANEAAKEGVSFVLPDEQMAAKIAGCHAERLNKGAEGAPSQVSDPQAAIDSYVTAHEKWKKILVDELGYDNTTQSWAEVAKNKDLPDLGPWTKKLATEVIDRHRKAIEARTP